MLQVYEFALSILCSLLFTFAVSAIWRKDQSRTFIYWIVFIEWRALGRNLEASSQLIFLKVHEFENRDLYLLLFFLAFSYFQHSDGKKHWWVFLRSFFSSRRLVTETLMEELNHVVIEIRVFGHSTKSKLKILYFQEVFGKTFRIFFKLQDFFWIWVKVFR